MTLRKPAVGTLLGATALVVALAGTGTGAEAAKLINGKLIKANTVSTKQIKDGTITSKDLSAALRSSNGKGIVGPRGVPGAVGPVGPAGAQGESGQNGTDGAAVAAVGINADGSKSFSKVNGSDLACTLCVKFYRATVTKLSTGRYCLTLERNSGSILTPSWVPYASAADHFGALASLNGSLPGFAQQYTTCLTSGFDIRTFDSSGSPADRAVTVAIF